MHHISTHVCGSCVLGGGRISGEGLTELGGFRGKSLDLHGICTIGGTRVIIVCSEEGMMGLPEEGGMVMFWESDV
jgi:hypothetical protein